MDSGAYIFLALMAAFIVAMIVAVFRSETAKTAALDDALSRCGAISQWHVATHMHGHPKVPGKWPVYLAYDKRDVLVVFNEGHTVATIPRDSITGASIEDIGTIQTHIDKRITATRLVVMGPFALAAPKKKVVTTGAELYAVRVNWEADGFTYTTQFSFPTVGTANSMLGFFAEARAKALTQEPTV